MTIPDLVADPGLVQRLIAEGETLFVERKEGNPADGLGPTVASFANMLGGWLLLGVDDDGQVVGYEPPGTVDLQDYVRDLLRTRVDPLPPFAALMVSVGEHRIGVVRVAESSDTPHITSEGVIYVRNPGGKQRVTDHRDILALARRGEDARVAAEQRLYKLPMIADAMSTPDRIFGDDPTLDDPAPLLEVLVRATPYTVSGAFADRALSSPLAEHAQHVAESLIPHSPYPQESSAQARVEPRARGLYCEAVRRGNLTHVDVAVDAGGVVALRMAERLDRHATELVRVHWLQPLIEGAVSLLAALDAYGRAAMALEIREAAWLTMATGPNTLAKINPADLTGGWLYVGGDIAVPAASFDIDELVERWTRELARAARLPGWEPTPTTADEGESP
jgi:hypothetical protein